MPSATRQNMVLIIGGVITLVLGIILADVVIDTTTTALTNASIGSFTGAEAIGRLIPFIYFTVVILIGVGMMGLGTRGFVGIAAFPIALGAVTPFPVQMALLALLGWGAVQAYKQHRTFRQAKQLE